MQKTHKIVLASAASLLAVGAFCFSSSALAMSDGGGRSSNDSAKHIETETENHAHDLQEKLKKQVMSDLAKKRENAKSRTQEQRQKSCEARKEALTNRMENKVSHANDLKAKFDGAYVKVKAFHDNKNLSTSDYASLVSKADTAQADAAAKIVALQALDVTIDCTQPKVADNVSAFQGAVGATRDSLKAYRSALLDLIKATHDSAKV